MVFALVLPVTLSVFMWHILSYCLTTIITRRRSFGEYWKYFVVHFNDVHAFAYNSAGSERIWMRFSELWIYCLELALTDFGWPWQMLGAIRAEARVGDLAKVFFLSVKQRTTLPISGQPNFTKFAQKTWFYVVLVFFRNNFFLKICP